MRIAVAWSPGPGVATEVSLELPRGANVADALRAATLHSGDDVAVAGTAIGVWGR